MKTSQAVFDEISDAGGEPMMWKTGHSLIKCRMKETGAALAGEMSGHIFFADRYFGFDDAIYAALRLIEVLEQSGQSLAQLSSRLPKRPNTPEIRLPCAETDKARVMARVTEWAASLDGVDVATLDGVRVTSDDGWWLLRQSNTEAVLVARCEGVNEAALARVKESLETALRAAEYGSAEAAAA